MSFVNLARTGFKTMSQHGKLIGTGKNNGIKVYEKLGCDGKRILTSIDKEGKPLKEIATQRHYDSFITNTKNHRTNVETKSAHHFNRNDGSYTYSYSKLNKAADNPEITSVDRFQLVKSSEDLKGMTLSDARKAKKEVFQNKDNVDFVSVQQANSDNSFYTFDAMPKGDKYTLTSNGNYKLNDEIILPNGYSVYFGDGKNGLAHYDTQNNNVHEANIAKSFIEGLQKIWTK